MSETNMTGLQGNMLYTIETCGRTLRDVVDHVGSAEVKSMECLYLYTSLVASRLCEDQLLREDEKGQTHCQEQPASFRQRSSSLRKRCPSKPHISRGYRFANGRGH